MNFADLPGFIANSQFMPSEGDEYAICDCNDTALGNFAKVETIGGGSNCVSVRASQTAQNTLASISDGTNDVGFTGTVGCSFQASVAGTTTLTVTSTNGSGALFPNDVVSGGVTGGTTIQPYGTGGTTGVGGVGTYALSGNSVATVAERSMTTTSNVVNVQAMLYGLFASIAAAWTFEICPRNLAVLWAAVQERSGRWFRQAVAFSVGQEQLLLAELKLVQYRAKSWGLDYPERR